jgi:hypothetical protein
MTCNLSPCGRIGGQIGICWIFLRSVRVLQIDWARFFGFHSLGVDRELEHPLNILLVSPCP